jgi:hypothetical protein
MALRESIKHKESSGSGYNRTTYPPEMALWASAIELALHDYTNGRITGSHNDDYHSAKDWIFRDDQNYVNSFDSICYLFNINPDSARQAIEADPVNVKLRLVGKMKKREIHV